MELETKDTVRITPDQGHSTGRDLASAIRARFERLGGVELGLPPREPIREPPQFDRGSGN